MDGKTIYAYSVSQKKKVPIVEVLQRKTLKNGANMVIGKDSDGNKVSAIVKRN
jgi:hypothetical protein